MIRGGKVKAYIKLGIAAILIASTLIAYVPIPWHMIEYTFLSNLIEGVVFAVSGVLLLTGRRPVPALIDLCLVIMALILLGIVLTNFGSFNFAGPFLFLHVVNPLLVLFHWMLITEPEQIRHPVDVLAVAAFPAAYIVFLFVHGAISGDYIYPIFDVTQLGVAHVAIFVGVIVVVFLAVAYALYFAGRAAAKRV